MTSFESIVQKVQIKNVAQINDGGTFIKSSNICQRIRI